MRTEEPRPVRLKDYRPPDWLIDTVELDVSLDPTATTVRAKLTLKPNAAGRPAPLVLDGEELKLRSLSLDGKPLPTEVSSPPPSGSPSRNRRTGRSSSRSRPTSILTANTQLMGLYRAGATYCTQCEAEGFRRITYFLDRPDVHGGLHDAHRGRQGRSARAAVQRQSDRAGRRRRQQAAFRRLARSVPKALLSVRAGRRRSGARRRTVSPPCPAARSRCTSTSSPARRTAAPTPWTASSAPCAGTRQAFGREYDLDIFMIVAVSAFNMGAMENKGLNIFNDKYVLASPDDRDRQRLRPHRGRDRPRIFPQLDRRPHHLPRLVSALPEGRPDGFPRPGIFRRSALARGRAHRRRAGAALASVRRGCRPPRPSGAAASSITRSTISTPRRSTRRAPKSSA